MNSCKPRIGDIGLYYPASTNTFDISIFDDLKEPDLKEHITRVSKIFYSKEE